ncbi:CRISPR-associated endoribonuclease Cas6 [Methanobacterium sp. MBAC-LM]|uniref:CRISPR-associated endoribonuclease Cas6 n=1 Tax=Methanobacterium sp. MBAC-LM TaxID=3412034 RepID=UPI003C728AAE
MRLKISLASSSSNYLIPYNYNHILSAIIYRKIADLDLASKLHFSKDFKFFTFSQLNIPNRMPGNGGIISKDGKFHFFLSSPNDYLIQSMVEGYLEDPEVIFMNKKLSVENVQLLEKPKFKKRMKMKTMSPLVARIKQEKNGKLKIRDLDPNDLRFYAGIQKNLIRKYKAYHGDYDGDGYVQIVPEQSSVQRKRIRIKKDEQETFQKAYNMHFEMEADKRLLEFAYDVGLGERNSMGFGMVMAL